ncbi:unnamed protein product [Bursaphelenchus okinawaensis]|uniref:Major facilitator superfamily (MFS) profile domain-containing protein n=1 Tax=Bursaphelenchus okinawaensis TaxID=465554 RepID=A0A811LS60_9BILA|nr:unnamed protein product [Bursaphelenchus okinawaensis]CAG9127791.1 unnamed protein product [Bursaphelenchus okinawaensis]
MEYVKPHRPLYHYKAWRLYVLLLLTLCVFVNFYLQTNLGMAMVCMVNTTAVERMSSSRSHNMSMYLHDSDKCPKLIEEEEESLGYRGKFVWTTVQQSFLVSALFYTSLLSITVSGTLADRFNTKYIILAAMIIYAALTVLSPLLAGLHYYAFLGGRFSMGFVDGLIFPAVTAVLARWFPPSERSTVAAVYTSGSQLAVIVNSLLTPKLCVIDVWDGWPFIFYVAGLVSLIIVIISYIFLSNSPRECRWVGMKESKFLSNQLDSHRNLEDTKPPKIPYFKILTSPVVLSVAANDFSYNFSYIMFSQFLPFFFRDVMQMSLSANGISTALPFIMMIVARIPLASFADYLKHKEILSVTATCKVMQTFACLGTASMFVAIAFLVDCTTPTLAMVLLVLFGVTFSGEIAGAFTAILFIAPPFVGTISSCATFVGMLAAIAAPAVFSWLNVYNTEAEYRNVFLFTAGVNLVAGILFVIFGSAEVQPWAKIPEENETTKKDNDKNDTIVAKF